MQIFELFPIPILQIEIQDYEDFNEQLLSLINSHFDKQEHRKLLSNAWNKGITSDQKSELGYTSHSENNTNFTHDESFRFFFDKLSGYINPAFQEMGHIGGWSFDNCWANVYPKGAWVPLHNHQNTHWAGAYYIQSNPDCGDIVFHDPKEYALGFEPRMRHRGNNKYGITPKPGLLVLFPGYLKHETHPNLTSDDRVMMSFNISMENIIEKSI